MRAVDTHAHLDFSQFDADRADLIAKLAEEKVGVINIATDFESNQKVVDLATKNNLIWAVVGLHPTEISSDTLANLAPQLERLKTLAQANPKVVAIGEVGLDYYREDSKNQAETQKAVLRQFLTLAIELNLPVVFHCRDAYGDLLTILADYPGTRGVVHCFTGNIDEAKRFLDLGLFISFTATITYPANDSQRQAVSAVPSEKILLETDCPFLVPASRRGQRNDPLTIFEIAQTIAEMKKIDQAEVLKLTTDNAVRLFGLNVA
ncbi:MAG: TatD-related deoxyribonuclease [Berkelbacteria bacterium GW2011_GWA2_46_7]|uniref:TatD-related deoxyribonuclease n=1 Tax=Berkelbacteria bacterium GW2011_GWA2_46_7 TaxID=1618335 RepID=A0A0G1QH82_9BACT|nr:MAG: TatD-related deoxyribonuclease [Berkelbacteria bacterium GW2011_GWA2_46_7]